jgi:hypothetical protein
MKALNYILMIVCYLACVLNACLVIIKHVNEDYPVLSENNDFKSLSLWGWQPYFNVMFIIIWEWDLLSILVIQGCWSYFALGAIILQ